MEVEGERCTQQGRVGVLRGGVLERVMNAGGMRQECQMEVFRGGLLNEGRCGPRGNHRIIILLLHTFFSFQHTQYKDPHTHSSGIFSTESLREKLTSLPAGKRWLPPTFTDGFIYF